VGRLHRQQWSGVPPVDIVDEEPAERTSKSFGTHTSNMNRIADALTHGSPTLYFLAVLFIMIEIAVVLFVVL
jgi:hypothetical protein